MLESARKLLENVCCLTQKLLEIYCCFARLGSARIFLENELLENAWLEFYFPCSKNPNYNHIPQLHCSLIKLISYIMPLF